jgi:Uma2 family endonuclease
MAVAALKYLTEEEYLALEDVAEFKHEYFDGQIFDMAGGQPEHALITNNVGGELRTISKEGDCGVFSSDLRIRVPATGLYTYPDISMVCGELERTDHNPPAAVNPTLIVEVLSESTAAYDRGEKWSHYQTIDSLKDYLLVCQDRPRVEHYSRISGEDWKYRLIEGLDKSISLLSVEGQVSLKEIYRGVKFPPTPALRVVKTGNDEMSANGNP